jgi:NAD(P)-dependent dehydrogenase (short-subunit alcohol dehydrogenase family)
LRFAAEGARVVCADLDVDRAKETARLVEDAGGTAVPFGVDVANEDEVVAAIAAVVDNFGRLDVVFNNVGIPTPRLGSTL